MPRRSVQVSDAPTVSKPWYQSRTVWVNVLTALVAMLGALSGSEWIAAHPEWVSVIALVVSLLNVALRFATTEGVR